jgi:hypothetical protein
MTEQADYLPTRIEVPLMDLNPEWKLSDFGPSRRDGKKFTAVFVNRRTGRSRTRHFGSRGMSDFTINRSPERRALYHERHWKRENWDDPTTPGALSRWLLWECQTRQEAFHAFLCRFGLHDTDVVFNPDWEGRL